MTYKVTNNQGASTTKTITLIVKDKNSENLILDDNKTNPDDDERNNNKKPNNGIPSTDNPETSVDSNTGLWSCVLTIPSVLLIVFFLRRGRKED